MREGVQGLGPQMREGVQGLGPHKMREGVQGPEQEKGGAQRWGSGVLKKKRKSGQAKELENLVIQMSFWGTRDRRWRV
jgi:hypothetical protein